MSVTHIREICEIADKHCDGYLRFTTRNNIEFMVDDKSKVQPLIDDLESRKFDGGSFKFPVGGTGAGVTNIVHTQGWIHCHTPATDASGTGQGGHGRSVRRFQAPYAAGPGAHLPGLLPEHVRCGALLRYRHSRLPPQTALLDHEYLDKMCEIPLAIAACPTAAIKPSKVKVGDKEVKSVAVNNDRCMFCGNCYTMCPSMPLADNEGDGIVIMVGGKVSNRISKPKFSKVVVAFLPNEAPRWARPPLPSRRSSKPIPPAPTSTNAWATGPRESAGSGSSRNANLSSPIISSMTSVIRPTTPGARPRSSSSNFFHMNESCRGRPRAPPAFLEKRLPWNTKRQKS